MQFNSNEFIITIRAMLIYTVIKIWARWQSQSTAATLFVQSISLPDPPLLSTESGLAQVERLAG